jgi:hypothetical protein
VSVSDPSNFSSQASVSFNTGYNTVNGYVAKWTGVTTGPDRSFSIKSEREDGFGASGEDKGYAMSAFKLEQAEPQTLPIQEGDVWRYFKGTEEPPTDWNTVGFDDSGWLVDSSGFGYGDGDDATVLSDMQGTYISVYLRKEFTVAVPSTVELSMDYDDSFVAYLNGVEVARANVTVTPLAYDTAADSDHEASRGDIYSNPQPVEHFVIGPSQLVVGTNVLAIQGHNKSLGSSDFSLIPTLEE